VLVVIDRLRSKETLLPDPDNAGVGNGNSIFAQIPDLFYQFIKRIFF